MKELFEVTGNTHYRSCCQSLSTSNHQRVRGQIRVQISSHVLIQELINMLKSVVFKSGRWSSRVTERNHGPRPSVGLQHRAHPFPAARPEAAAAGLSTGRVSPGGHRQCQSSLAGPAPVTGDGLPAVQRDELRRGTIPALQTRCPSAALLLKPRSLRALQPKPCR